MNEKSVSKQQQKFFGIVRGLQTGKIKDASPEAKKAAATMSKKDVKDFAATKHKGLPKMKESLPSKDEACWDTHKQVGMKKKGGKMVPNCVPKENVSSADRKPEVYTKADGKRGVRMVKVDREIVKNHGESFRYRPDPFKSRASLAKSAKYKEAEAEYQKDKEFARKKAQQKNVKKEEVEGVDEANLRKMDHDEFMKHGDSNPKGRADPAWNAERKRRYRNAQAKNYRKMKKEKKDISVADYKKKTGKKTVSLKHLTKNTHIDPFREETVNLKSFTTVISELTDRQRAEIAKRKAANQAKRGARRGPSKGTKSSEGDWTADQQKSAKPLSFEINKNDKHDDVHKTLAKAADASHPSLGGRKVKVKINGKSKEMAHKDLQHAVDLHKRLPLGKKAAVMNLIRDKGHEGVTAAANHFRKTYK